MNKMAAAEAFWLLAIFVLGAVSQANAEKQKRQLFREQVLPSKGGKIPEDAFRADRLALNRLNKEGISVPDGVILEARHVHKHPTISGPMREVLKVYLTPEGRYVPPEGRYNYQHPKAVDTTYLVQHPVGTEPRGKFRGGYNSFNKLQRYPGHREVGNPTRPQIYKPVLASLIIPSREELLQKTDYPPWTPEYSWDLIYEPFDDYFVNSIALFNSHQILTDYEGFFNDFHRRSVRHIAAIDTPRSDAKTTGNFWTNVGPAEAEKTSSRHPGMSKVSDYPDLRKIPKTRFTCGGKRGMFADVETNCQVFHLCDPSGKNSFLCPPGTIFNEAKKRCELWESAPCDAANINEH